MNLAVLCGKPNVACNAHVCAALCFRQQKQTRLLTQRILTAEIRFGRLYSHPFLLQFSTAPVLLLTSLLQPASLQPASPNSLRKKPHTYWRLAKRVQEDRSGTVI